jgi:hypothetical protein
MYLDIIAIVLFVAGTALLAGAIFHGLAYSREKQATRWLLWGFVAAAAAAAAGTMSWQDGRLIGGVAAALAISEIAVLLGLKLLHILAALVVKAPAAEAKGPTRDGREGGDEEVGIRKGGCSPKKVGSGGGQVPWEDSKRTRGFFYDTYWRMAINCQSGDTYVTGGARSTYYTLALWWPFSWALENDAYAVATGVVHCDEKCVAQGTAGEDQKSSGPCSAAVLIKPSGNVSFEVTIATGFEAHVYIKKVTVAGSGTATGASGSGSVSVSTEIEMDPGDKPKAKVVRNYDFACVEI